MAQEEINYKAAGSGGGACNRGRSQDQNNLRRWKRKRYIGEASRNFSSASYRYFSLRGHGSPFSKKAMIRDPLNAGVRRHDMFHRHWRLLDAAELDTEIAEARKISEDITEQSIGPSNRRLLDRLRRDEWGLSLRAMVARPAVMQKLNRAVPCYGISRKVL